MTNKPRQKVAVVTGGTDGIGRSLAVELLQGGATVIMVGRNTIKGEHRVRELRAITNQVNISYISADLTLAAEAKRLAQEIAAQHDRVDYLIHSAGMMLPQKQVTAEGNEALMAVQYLTRYLLTEQLLPLLRAAEDGRVVTLSGGSRSVGRDPALSFDNFNAEQGYKVLDRLRAVSDANLLWTVDFMEREPDVRIYNYAPGIVKTRLGRLMPAPTRWLMKVMGSLMGVTPDEAAAPIVRLLSEEYPSGHYDKALEVATVPAARAPAAVRTQLRALSDRLTA